MRQTYNQKFNLMDLYNATVSGLRALPHLILNRISKQVDDDLIERLMLATTEVNGCEVCSYAHTKMALKQGFSQAEIDALLSGSKAYIDESESTAIFFAQHYADTIAKPEKESFAKLKEIYGKKQAMMMVRAIQVMMMANIQGIPLSAFLARLKGRPYKKSHIFYELGMLFFAVVILPLALIDALIRSLIRIPIVRYAQVK